MVGWLISLIGLPQAVPWDIAVIVTAGTLNDRASTTTCDGVVLTDCIEVIVSVEELRLREDFEYEPTTSFVRLGRLIRNSDSDFSLPLQ